MNASTLDHRYDLRTAAVDPAPRARLASLVAGTSAAATAALLWLVQIVLVDVAARGHGSDLREALTQWDAQWMTLIAEHGYGDFAYTADPAEPTIFQSVAFFPGIRPSSASSPRR